MLHLGTREGSEWYVCHERANLPIKDHESYWESPCSTREKKRLDQMFSLFPFKGNSISHFNDYFFVFILLIFHLLMAKSCGRRG